MLAVVSTNPVAANSTWVLTLPNLSHLYGLWLAVKQLTMSTSKAWSGSWASTHWHGGASLHLNAVVSGLVPTQADSADSARLSLRLQGFSSYPEQIEMDFPPHPSMKAESLKHNYSNPSPQILPLILPGDMPLALQEILALY